MTESPWSDAVAATAIARLDKIGPRRIAAVLAGRGPGAAREAVVAGEPIDGVPLPLLAGWRRALTEADPVAIATDLRCADLSTSWVGSPGHPAFLTNDIDPAPVLFRHGAPVAEGRAAVAIVGTRRASGVGREVARELGFGLAAAGITVVSGLALGIDGAAHEGALAAEGAPAVAFVGGGADVVYPRRHADLWCRLGRMGTIVSEAPPGAPPSAWRFPARNRLIAACADLVVVVESRRTGGSLLTVDEAIRRDRQVMAVPGSLRNPAAEGTNALIADGCAPVSSVDDVLVALGLSRAAQSARRSDASPAADHRRPRTTRTLARPAIPCGPTQIPRTPTTSP